MTRVNGTLRRAIGVSSALGLAFAAGAAVAQTVSGVSEIDLGNVVATGQQSGATAPSATGSLQQAQALKKLAPNVISVQPQSQIQKLPDVNVAEALQRVPGISMQSDTGAGRFINIRGLDADLNGTSYDGVHLTAANQATPTGGARAVAFDAFPAGMIGGVEVTKSTTPAQDAEGIGGSVNLLPLSLPAGGGPLVQFSQAGGEETLRHTGVYETGVTLGNSFAVPGLRSFANAKPFSLIVNYSLHSDRRGIDDVEEDYNSPTEANAPASVQDLQFRRYDGHRITQGFGGELDFDPDPATHFYLRGMQGGYDEQLNKDRLQLSGLDGSGTDANGNPGTLTDNGGGNYTATGATAQKDFTNSNERIAYQLAAIGGRALIANAVNVDFRASWTQGSDVTPRSYGTEFDNTTPFTVNYSTASSQYRSYNAPGIDLSNPAGFTLVNASNTPGRTIDAEFGTAANVFFADNVLGNLGVAKFGVAARFRTEGAYQVEYDYNNLNTNATLAQLAGGNTNTVYYNSHYAIGPNVAYQSLFPQLGAPTNNIATNLGSFAHNSENVYAGYGQETMEFGPFEVLAGARFEDTNGTYRAYLSATDANGNTTYTPNKNKQDYINAFPSVQLKYAVDQHLQFRAAWSTAIARPGFQQISAAQTLTLAGASNGQNSVTEGNPSLKPTTENAFDLTAEYYSPYDGLLSVNPFYKLLNNYIVSTQSEGTFQGQPAQINAFENIGGAFVRGVEFDAEQKFYFLPAPLDGLGADGNITFVDSRGRYDTDANGNFLKANQLPETSPITYNAAMFYEKGPLSFRLAATYVSRNLFTVVAGGRALDQFSYPRFRLDLDASLQATPNLQIFAQGKNLTNTLLEFTQSASSAYPIQREFYEQDFLVGIRYSLGGSSSE